MLFNHLTTTVLAAFTLLSAPVLGGAIPAEIPVELEGDFQVMAADIGIKFWNSNQCKKSYGGTRSYNRGSCINLDSAYIGVSIQNRQGVCRLVKYKWDNCNTEVGRITNLDDCYDVGEGVKSLGVTC
ncbi:uncharacterized protein B0I36DRAFT_389307, partial [Microdochium trichocladiopsis]